MKHALLALLASLFTLAAGAANTKTSVSQVTEAVVLTTDVDYHITSTTPFGDNGTIDIQNTDHAVVIFDNLKPSLAKSVLSKVTINGAAAKNGSNCQLKLYNRGAILLPYGGTSFRPLTVYDQQNFGGESYNNLTEGHNGSGFMKNLPTAWNNRIQSFTLKRGYMVTFALKDTGSGYSRCFIAANEDLAVNLPALMAGRITSYRLFKWYDTSKVALANDTRASSVSLLNVTSCYSFSKGESRLPDAECVPHHIYEDWPSAADCGNQDYSCHLKTNNEPGNSADDHPQSVDDILNNWQNLMRTGLRLCSPSSHDGSLSHLRACLDSIDARGWRCDIIDLHCYWAEGSFNTWSFYDQWANKYGRPIWISEWVWGASWNSNGAFASGVTEDQNRDAIQRITNSLNSWDCIERYFYWNSERDPSKILRNDGSTLTPAGSYYSSINSGLGYCNFKNYIPKNPRLYKVTDLEATYKYSSRTDEHQVTLTWSNINGDLTDMAIVQMKNGTTWTAKDTIMATDATSCTCNLTLNESEAFGLKEFRIVNADFDGKRRISNTASFFNGGAENFGDLMGGRMELASTEKTNISFATQENTPIVIAGMISNKNTANGIVGHLSAVAKSRFTYYLDPWTLDSEVSISRAESIDFLVAQPGVYQWGDMQAVIDTCIYTNAKGALDSYSAGDVIEVFYRQPFAEGVTPVVVAQNLTSQSGCPTHPVVFDVNNVSFKMKLVKQKDNTKTVSKQRAYYIAITPGQARLGDSGKCISAGVGDVLTGSTAAITVFRDEQGDTLFLRNAYVIADAQTHNLDATTIMRKTADRTQEFVNAAGEKEDLLYGISVRRQLDSTSGVSSSDNKASVSGDYIGWIAISDAISTPGDVNGDGNVDLTDAIMIVYYSLGATQSNFNAAVSDVNGDGVTDLTDAIIVVYQSLGAEM